MIEEVNVEEMLAARDKRVALQNKLLNSYQGTLICFTMNIPGPVKVTPLVEVAFRDGVKALTKLLEDKKINVLHREIINAKTGLEAFFLVEGDSKEIKCLTCQRENQDALGRLFDIDVLEQSGRKISREEINLPGRLCLLCQESAQACARSRKHTVEQLTKHINKVLEEHFLHKLTDAARKALLSEVYATPKPGLVDKDNQGAHKDMDVTTFEKSTEAIVPFLAAMGEKGYHWQGAGEALFGAIRPIGAAAEKAMFKATNNVNTHKGIIFSLGIIMAYTGWLFAREGRIAPEEILRLCGESTQDILAQDFAHIDKYHPHTHGEKLYVKYGYKGIRGVVAEGFKPLREISLPLLRELRSKGQEENSAHIQTLLALMAQVEDTNILIRTSPDMLSYAQSQAQRLLSLGGALSPEGLEAVWKLNEDFIAKNMSPGGSADLLIATIFLLELE